MRTVILLTALWLIALPLSGCTQKNIAAVVPQEGEAKRIEMTATSFGFSPNLIQTQPGAPLTIEVINTSDIEHNITIKDPEGKTLVNRDLPEGEVVEVVVPLERAGTYRFYCDMTMHTTLGMEGRIEAKR
ncbi:MAG: cupredoxin domain-containing protein [Desulfovibrionales bacterium]